MSSILVLNRGRGFKSHFWQNFFFLVIHYLCHFFWLSIGILHLERVNFFSKSSILFYIQLFSSNWKIGDAWVQFRFNFFFSIFTLYSLSLFIVLHRFTTSRIARVFFKYLVTIDSDEKKYLISQNWRWREFILMNIFVLYSL